MNTYILVTIFKRSYQRRYISLITHLITQTWTNVNLFNNTKTSEHSSNVYDTGTSCTKGAFNNIKTLFYMAINRKKLILLLILSI